jgi:hypothetical protein
MDLEIRQLDGLAEAVHESILGDLLIALPGVDQVTMNLGGSHLAGDLTGRGTTHAVGDEIQRAALAQLQFLEAGIPHRSSGAQIGNEECVLIVIAAAAAIGQGEERSADLRRGRTPRRNSIKGCGKIGTTRRGGNPNGL